MSFADVTDLAVKLIMFGWFGYARLHFAKGDKEPVGMTAVKVIYVVGLFINLWLYYSMAGVSEALRMLGLSTTLASAAIFFLAMRASKAAGLHVAFSELTGTSLVSHGIYRLVRHPFYLAYLAYWSSWCVSVGFSYLSVAVLFVLLVLYVFSIRLEERELERKFGDKYREYKKSTSLFLPYIL